MKQPKKLTRDHKKFLRARGINPDLWMLQSEDQNCYIYVNKEDGTTIQRFKFTDTITKNHLTKEN